MLGLARPRGMTGLSLCAAVWHHISWLGAPPTGTVTVHTVPRRSSLPGGGGKRASDRGGGRTATGARDSRQHVCSVAGHALEPFLGCLGVMVSPESRDGEMDDRLDAPGTERATHPPLPPQALFPVLFCGIFLFPPYRDTSVTLSFPRHPTKLSPGDVERPSGRRRGGSAGAA